MIKTVFLLFCVEGPLSLPQLNGKKWSHLLLRRPPTDGACPKVDWVSWNLISIIEYLWETIKTQEWMVQIAANRFKLETAKFLNF